MPTFEPIDLNQLVPATLGCMVVLIPVLGLTLRFAIKPLIAAFGSARGLAAPYDLDRLARRVLELEQHVQQLEERQALAGAEGSAKLRSLPFEGSSSSTGR